jgi:hypothetical protein
MIINISFCRQSSSFIVIVILDVTIDDDPTSLRVVLVLVLWWIGGGSACPLFPPKHQNIQLTTIARWRLQDVLPSSPSIIYDIKIVKCDILFPRGSASAFFWA